MANITIRVNPDVKIEAEALFGKLGMSMSGAVNIFLRQTIRQQAIPFEIKAKTPEDEYDEYFTPELVKSILESAEHIKHGECISFTLDELISMEEGEMPLRAIEFLNSRERASDDASDDGILEIYHCKGHYNE